MLTFVLYVTLLSMSGEQTIFIARDLTHEECVTEGYLTEIRLVTSLQAVAFLRVECRPEMEV